MAENLKIKIDTKLQFAALLVTVIAIVVTVVFSLRSEKTKEITITYLSKRSLVTIEGPRPSVGLEVRLGGSVIAAPWLVSAKLQNTGNVPIEERDIEARAKLSFTKGKTIAVDILAKNQPGLFAAIKASGSEVEIEHKLLNPGDWLTFDILFDGEPEVPPALTLRISGVSEPIQVVASSDTRRTYPTLFSSPAPLTYLTLAVSTLVVLAIMAAAIGIAVNFVAEFFKAPTQRSKENMFDMFFDRPIKVVPSSVPARTIYAALGEPPIVELLASDDSMSSAVTALPEELLKGLNLTVDRAVAVLRSELMRALHKRLSGYFGVIRPVQRRDELCREFERLDLKTLSGSQLVDEAREIYAQHSINEPKNKNDISGLVAALALAFTGLCLTFIVGGAWRSVLGF